MRRIVFAAVMSAVACLALPDLGAQAAEADINRRLFAAVRANDFGAVRRIIGEGADPFVFNEQGAAPVDIAVDKGYFDIAHYLLAAQNQRLQSGRAATKEPPSPPPPALPNVTPAPLQAVTVSAPTPLASKPVTAQAVPPIEPAPAIAPQTVQMVNEVQPRPEFPPELSPETPPTTNPSPDPVQSKKAVSNSVDVEPVVAPADEPQPAAVGRVGQADDIETPVFDRLLSFFKGDETPEPDLPGEVDDPVSTSEQVAISNPASVVSDVPPEKPAEPYRAPPPPKPLMNTLAQQVVTQPEPPAEPSKISERVEPEPPEPIEPPGPPEPEAVELPTRIVSEPSVIDDPEPVISAAALQPESVAEAETIDKADSLTALEQIVDFLKGKPSDASQVSPQPATSETTAVQTKVAPTQPRLNELPQAIVQSNDAPVAQPPTLQPESVPSPADMAEQSIVQATEVSESQVVPVIEPTPKVDPSPVTDVSAATDNPPTHSPEPVVETSSLFDQLVGFFKPGQSPETAAQEQSVPIVAEASPPVVPNAEPAPEETASLTSPVEPQVPVVKTKPVQPHETQSSPAPAGTIPSTIVLRADDMVFGKSGRLGKQLGEDRVGLRDCVSKPAWGSSFCIENIDWPEEVREAFGSPAYYAGGGRAIVRYDAARATQYHVLFPVSSFSQLAQYFKRKFGLPSETPEIWTSMLGEPKRFNKTFRWRAPETDGSGFLMVEMREIDDLRWSAPPDARHGVVRLYREGAKTVFELLTTADLLLIQVRKGMYQQDIPPGNRPKG